MSAIRKFAGSAPFRKGKAAVLTIPRTIARASASLDDYRTCPPILVNSLPKSGTHLLLQLVRSLPVYRHYGRFIASTPSLTMRRRTDPDIAQRIRQLVPAEICASHIQYSDAASKALTERPAIMLFIARDARDVFWSEMQYLLHMNRWHRAGRLARRINEPQHRFEFFLHGMNDSATSDMHWPSFASRVAPYLLWQNDPNVFSCRYEDFKSESALEESICALANYLRSRSERLARYPLADLMARMRISLRPEASHTFRRGQTNEWQSYLSKDQIDQLNTEVARLNLS